MQENEIPAALISKLIIVGKACDISQMRSLLTEYEQKNYGYIMRLRPEPWLQISEKLNVEEMIALIKCLTLAEKVYPDWRSGSVSPVIWLFRMLMSRAPEFRDNLVDWILANTENMYLPFGSMNLGAKSLEEHIRLQKALMARRQGDYDAEMRRQELAQKRKAQEASKNLFGAVRRSDILAVKALLAKGADTSIEDLEGINVIEHARSKGNKAILELLETQKSDQQ